MSVMTLSATQRTDLGKGASRRLRRENKVPAVIYGADKEAVSITLEHKEVIKAQESESFYSQILNLEIDGVKTDALVKDMQRHPFKPLVMHIDFLRVDPEHKINKSVPIHFLNEEKAAAVKAGGTVNHLLNEVELVCLPKDLPEAIEIDISVLELGQTLHLSDLNIAEGVQIAELTKGENHDQAVVTITAAKGNAEAEDETEAEDAAE